MVENKTNLVQASFWLDEALQRQFTSKVKADGLLVKDVLAELVRQYVSGQRPVTNGYPYPRTKQAHETLEGLLAQDRGISDWVKRGLRICAERACLPEEKESDTRRAEAQKWLRARTGGSAAQLLATKRPPARGSSTSG